MPVEKRKFFDVSRGPLPPYTFFLVAGAAEVKRPVKIFSELFCFVWFNRRDAGTYYSIQAADCIPHRRLL